jgi:SPX domain protein involved in polyphosphate accumulation
MIARVPFSVFEIKLAGREMPDSMLNLIENGVIIEAAKFSKFLTGAAAFCKGQVPTVKYQVRESLKVCVK